MADDLTSGGQGFNIEVNDKVAPSIAPNLAEIGKQARSAQNSLASLKSILSALDSTGVNGLRTTLSGLSTTTSTLANATTKMGTAADATAPLVVRLANSYNTLNFAVQAALQTLTAYAPVAITARNASQGFGTAAANAARGIGGVGRGAGGVISPVIAASAAIRGLEGNFGSSVRAGERFLVTTLKLGPILQAAFPIFGAIAMLGIIDILSEHVGHVVDAYKNMGAAAVNAEIAAINAGDKIVKSQQESLFSADTVARAFAGDFNGTQDIEIVNVATKLRDLSRQRAEFSAIARSNESGLTGETQQKQRTADLKAEVGLVQQQRDAVNDLATALEKQARQGRIIHDDAFLDRGGTLHPATDTFVSSLSDKQRTDVENQLRAAKTAVLDLDSEIRILNSDADASAKKEPLKGAIDSTKEARKQLQLFKDEFAKLKINAGGVITPQQELDALKSQQSRALPANKPDIDSRVGVASQAVERQTAAVDQLAQKYKDEVEAIGLYSDAQKIAAVQSKIDIELQKLLFDTHSAKAQLIKDEAASVILNAGYQRELNSIYTSSVGPLRDFQAGLRAVNTLEYDGAISHTRANQELSKLARTYNDSVHPLAEYAHGLQNEIDLYGKYGTALAVATQVQQIQEQFRQRGQVLSQEQIGTLTETLTQLEHQKSVQQSVNNLYDQNIGQVEKLKIATDALNVAKEKGILSDQQYIIEATKAAVQTSELNIQLAGTKDALGNVVKASGKDIFVSIFGNYIKDFKSFEQSTTQIFQRTWSTIADGAANAFGRAIAYGESLGDALKDVARQALSEIISGFVKLGIELLIVDGLAKLLHIHLPDPQGDTTKQTAKNLAASVAAVAVITAAEYASVKLLEEPMWSLAEAVSLATFGANAIAAVAGISAVTAAGQGAMHFNQGGVVPGTGSTDTVPAILTPGEGVLNRRAMQTVGANTVNRLNAGAQFVQGSSTVGIGLNIKIIRDGSTNVSVERDGNDIRIIAQQEARKMVEQHAPGVIAAQVQNPNSTVSKSLNRNTTAKRQR